MTTAIQEYEHELINPRTERDGGRESVRDTLHEMRGFLDADVLGQARQVQELFRSTAKMYGGPDGFTTALADPKVSEEGVSTQFESTVAESCALEVDSKLSYIYEQFVEIELNTEARARLDTAMDFFDQQPGMTREERFKLLEDVDNDTSEVFEILSDARTYDRVGEEMTKLVEGLWASPNIEPEQAKAVIDQVTNWAEQAMSAMYDARLMGLVRNRTGAYLLSAAHHLVDKFNQGSMSARETAFYALGKIDISPKVRSVLERELDVAGKVVAGSAEPLALEN